MTDEVQAPAMSEEEVAARNAQVEHMTPGVYAITNMRNGKSYVGSSKNVKKRMRTHAWHLRRGDHHSQKLQRAWNLYGDGLFTFSTLLYCAEGDLLFYEQRAIDRFNAIENGYNVLPKAGTTLGRSCSEETKAKLSATKKGLKFSPEFCAMRSKIQTGKKRTQETKDKISATSKGRKKSLESIEKMRGRVVSTETRAKLSSAAKKQHEIRRLSARELA